VTEPKCTIIIPALPPSKNKWASKHHMAQHRMFNEWRELVFGMQSEVIWQESIERPIKGKVAIGITFYFPDNRRRDSRNYDCYPPLLDSLTMEVMGKDKITGFPAIKKHGLCILEDDNNDVLLWNPTTMIVDKDLSPRTEIKIWKVEGWK